MCREVIWNTYTKDEKDRIAEYLICFGNGKTSAHNWRLLNMLILGFLHMEGYEVDKDCIRDHAQTILSYRKEYFDFDYTFQDRDSIDLADYALPNGMLRIDKMRIHKGYSLYRNLSLRIYNSAEDMERYLLI